MQSDKIELLVSEPRSGLVAPAGNAEHSKTAGALRQLRSFCVAVVALTICFVFPLCHLITLAAGSELNSYILLIPFISIFLVWLNRRVLSQPSPPSGGTTAAFLAAGTAALFVYCLVLHWRVKLMPSDYLAALIPSYLLFFFGACSHYLGRAFLRACAFPLGFLIFMVPVPAVVLGGIDSFLQYGSAVVAAGFFTLAGTPFLQDGLVFQLPGITIQIAPECSGIHSSLVLFITSVLASHFFLRTPWCRAVFILSVIPLGILRNGFRVFTIGELCVHISPQMIDSPIHHKGGPIFFALSLIPLFILLVSLKKFEPAVAKPQSKPVGNSDLEPPKQVMHKMFRKIPILMALAVLMVAGTGCTAKMKESYHLKRGDKYYDAGQFDQAQIEYEKVLRAAPQNAWAWNRLGSIFFDDGRLGEAVQILGRAQQLATNNLEVRLKLGTIHLEAGQLQAARDEADFVFERSPTNEQAPILLAEADATNQFAATRLRLQKMSPPGGSAPLEVALGVLSFRQDDLKTAETEFLRAESIDPKFSDAYSALGNLYLAKQDLKPADKAFKKAAELGKTRSGKILQYAQFKFQRGETAAGKQLLEGVVKKAPDYLPAWIALAQLAAAENKNADGVTFLGNVLNRDPQNLEALLLKGRLKLNQGETAQAINDFELIAQMFPKFPIVYYHLALGHLANHQTDKAIDDLNKVLHLNPKDANAIQALAEIQIQNGYVAPAIVALRQLIQDLPQIVPARLLLADAYGIQGNLDNAIQIYRELENTFPNNPRLHLLLGTTLLQQNNIPEARMELDQAIKLEPNYVPALEQRVNLDLSENQYAAAQQRVEQQIRQNPNIAELQLLLANVLTARGDTNQAENSLLKAIQLQPDFEQAYLMLAQLYTATGQNQKAEADLQAALTQNPNDSPVLLLLGMAYEVGKDYNAAGNTYEKLLTLSPNNVAAINNLACLCAEHFGQLDKGYQLARQACNLAPTDPSIADTLGWILYQKGEYSSALNLLQESAAQFNSVPEVQYHLGMTYYMMDDEANARMAFHHALQPGQEFLEKNKCNQCLTVLDIDPTTAGKDQRVWLEKWVASQANDLVALLRLASIYQRDGLEDKALAAYEAALQAAPQNPLAMVNLARLYTPRDAQKAFSLAKSAYDLTPNDPMVTFTLGRLAFLTGDYKWALSLLQLTAQVQPQNPEVLYELADILYSVGQVSDARTTMEKALQTGVSFSRAGQARNFLAMTEFEIRPEQVLAAKSQVDEILRSTPDFKPALMAKAIIAMQKSGIVAAEQIYANVLQVQPDFVPAQKHLAILYASDPADNDKAYVLALKTRTALPADPEVSKILGIIIFRQGDYLRAANFLKESIGPRNDDAESLYYLGMAEYHLKNLTESKAALQRSLDLDLSGTKVVEAKAVLAGLK